MTGTTVEVRADLRRLIRDRLMNDSQIARRLGVHPRVVRKEREAMGFEPVRSYYSDVSCTIVLPAVVAGAGEATAPAIAERTGRTERQVRRWLAWLEAAQLVVSADTHPITWTATRSGVKVTFPFIVGMVRHLQGAGPMTAVDLAAALDRPAGQVSIWLEAALQAELVCIEDYDAENVPMWCLWSDA
jgi:hypothetical protein